MTTEKFIAVATIVGCAASNIQGGSASQILAGCAGIVCGFVLFAVSMKGV